MGTLRDQTSRMFHRSLRLADAAPTSSENESDGHNDMVGARNLTECNEGCDGRVQGFRGKSKVRRLVPFESEEMVQVVRKAHEFYLALQDHLNYYTFTKRYWSDMYWS